jgi:hypothetical protein
LRKQKFFKPEATTSEVESNCLNVLQLRERLVERSARKPQIAMKNRTAGELEER